MKAILIITIIFLVTFYPPDAIAAQSRIDFLNLNELTVGLFNAYDRVSVAGAWRFLNDRVVNLSPLTIGVIDTGYDSKHHEFEEGVNTGNTPANAKSDSGVLISGILYSHGTNVAGIIGANNISAPSSANYIWPHMNGIISGVHNLNYRLEMRKMGFTLFDVLGSISDSVEKGAKIINLSFGKNEPISNLIFFMKFNATPDVLYIVSAGNFEFDFLGINIEGIPAELTSPAGLGDNLNNVITVGASTLDDKRASFSNFGSAVNVAAPGDKVWSPTFFRGSFDLSDYQFFSGTSASAPMVTGVAGLLKALEPEYQKHITGLAMSPEKIKEVLVKSADPIQTGETNKRLGSGCYNETATSTGCRLNAHRAVAWYLPPESVENLTTSNITANSITLNWSKPSDFDFQNPDFASFKIFRDTNSDVDINDILVTAITNPDTTTFTDSGLTSNTAYFYKVFVFDKANLFTASNEVSAITSGVSQLSNTWKSVGPMTTERADHTATLLNDGRVLIAGGFKGEGKYFTVLSSAEIFNPAINSFISVGSMSVPRTFHTATLLNDGRILITGGTDNNGLALNSAEIFNPATNSFSSVGNLTTGRFYHTATLLNDGKILIAGGNNISLKSTEIFDPSTNAFSSGTDMTVARSHYAAARLNDGQVLLVNGLLSGTLMSVDIYDPLANVFTSATSSAEQLGLSINTLPNGKVFIAGSKLFNQPNGQAAEIFDPADNSFIEVGPMLISGTALNSAVLLNNGKVLFVGASVKAQIFNPQTDTFNLTGNLNTMRFIRHQVTLLQDGRALLTGGQLSDVSLITTNAAEVYKP